MKPFLAPVALAVLLAPRIHAEDGFTPMRPEPLYRPSNIFFDPYPEPNDCVISGCCPACVVQRCENTRNNKAGGPLIIAREFEIRGWLFATERNNGAAAIINMSCQVRDEDHHYKLILDYDWILDPRANPTLAQLNNASLPGHAIHNRYCQTGIGCPRPSCISCYRAHTGRRLPFVDLLPNSGPSDLPCFDWARPDPATCDSQGLTANSFVLPGNDLGGDAYDTAGTIPIFQDAELNAYWDDVRRDLPPDILAAAAQRGLAEYHVDHGRGYNVVWPFNLTNPDGTGELRPGDYVRIRGPLYQDAHGDEQFDFFPLTGQGKSHLEIHPVDRIERAPSRNLCPRDPDCARRAVTALTSGRIISERDVTDSTPWRRIAVLKLRREPIRTITIYPTRPAPSPAATLHCREWVSGRFTDIRSIRTHGCIVDNRDGNPRAVAWAEANVSSAIFMATYEVWWEDASHIYVDAAATFPQHGTPDRPFPNLTTVVGQAREGATIHIKGSAPYRGPLTINRRMTLIKWGGEGTVQIGG